MYKTVPKFLRNISPDLISALCSHNITTLTWALMRTRGNSVGLQYPSIDILGDLYKAKKNVLFEVLIAMSISRTEYGGNMFLLQDCMVSQFRRSKYA
jgi:hypothetical protein